MSKKDMPKASQSLMSELELSYDEILRCYDYSHSLSEFIEMLRPTIEPKVAELNAAMMVNLTYEQYALNMARTLYVVYNRTGGTKLGQKPPETDSDLDKLLRQFGLN